MARPGFGGFPGGNMQQLMRQAQKMQQQMTEMQEKLDAEEYEAASGGGMVQVKVSGKRELTAITIDPQVIDPDDAEMLEDLIESANGQPVLIAYWFKHDRQRIWEHLTACGYSPRDIRESKDIKDWNDGKIQVALLHPASAGHGLNIQSGGHILIWFGLTWSLELYQQTNARLWRQGQTSSTVVIHHSMTKGTIDVQIMQALERKDKTQSALIDAVKAQLGGIR
jgi:DNA-binding YbaB/EbfC family protein